MKAPKPRKYDDLFAALPRPAFPQSNDKGFFSDKTLRAYRRSCVVLFPPTNEPKDNSPVKDWSLKIRELRKKGGA